MKKVILFLVLSLTLSVVIGLADVEEAQPLLQLKVKIFFMVIG